MRKICSKWKTFKSNQYIFILRNIEKSIIEANIFEK